MTTPSRGSSRKGSQEPTRLVVPDFASSDWERCHAINAAGGIELLPWQDGILKGWLGVDAAGKWAAGTCGGSLARQNGKTLGLVVPRVTYGMIVRDEEVLYTSHLQKTSTETFESVAEFFDKPALRKHVKDIKTALGREQVIMKRGGRIKFLARTRNGGRGQHGDLLIFDEALELDEDSQSSFIPAISASANPQVIYISSPPTASSVGGVFRGIRERALSGQSNRLAWFEWSVDEIGDVRDKARWYATNPSLGTLIQEATVEAEVEQMAPDTFARERLGWWSSNVELPDFAIPTNAFLGLAVDVPPTGGRCAYGVKFSPDGSGVSLCAARLHDGKVYVEQVAREPMGAGLTWLAEWLAERKTKGCCVVVDGRSGAPALVDKLGRMPKGYVVTPSVAQVTAAATALVDHVNERKLEWWREQADLCDSATTSVRRKIGSGTSGGWGFGGDNPTPIEAASLALWGVLNSKRDPERRAVVW